jgi:hypothetical protein
MSTEPIREALKRLLPKEWTWPGRAAAPCSAADLAPNRVPDNRGLRPRRHKAGRARLWAPLRKSPTELGRLMFRIALIFLATNGLVLILVLLMVLLVFPNGARLEIEWGPLGSRLLIQR